MNRVELNKIIREELKKTLNEKTLNRRNLNEGFSQSVEKVFASQIDDIMMTWHDYENGDYDDDVSLAKSKVELLNLIYQAIEGNSGFRTKITIR